MKKIIFILFLFYLTHIEIFSETVFLRDGTVLHGKLKSQAINEIVIRIDEVEQKISKKNCISCFIPRYE
jgi:sRNA-binding regulator protein Hfq